MEKNFGLRQFEFNGEAFIGHIPATFSVDDLDGCRYYIMRHKFDETHNYYSFHILTDKTQRVGPKIIQACVSTGKIEWKDKDFAF